MIHKATNLALASLLAAGAANAQTYSNETGGSVTFYGQLNPSVLSFDDGDDTDTNLVDNTHSNSRVGFHIDQDLANGQKLRFTFETALAAPGSAGFSQGSSPIWDWQRTDIRKVDFAWSGSFGTVYVGQGSMATDGIASSDLSGTGLASAVATSDTAGSYLFRESDGSLSDIALGDVYGDFDGGRKGRFRYDTPDWNGFTFGASYGTDILDDVGETTYYDVAGYYDNTVGSIQLVAGLGYAWEEDDDGDTSGSWAGSVSGLHEPTGLNATFAVGGDDEDASYYYTKLGWTASLWSVGKTSFSADYYGGSDFINGSSDSTQWGVQAAQTFDDLDLEAYIGYAQYGLEVDGTDVDYADASSVLAGVRWSF